MNDEHLKYLTALEDEFGIPVGLLAAQQKQESNFNPNAVSPKGARGISQFMPATAEQYGIDPFDPVQASRAQAQMMSELLNKYGGDVPSALAGYNWGMGNLDKRGMSNAPRETRDYIAAITQAIGGGQRGEAPVADGAVSGIFVDDGSADFTDDELLGSLPEQYRSDKGAQPEKSILARLGDKTKENYLSGVENIMEGHRLSEEGGLMNWGKGTGLKALGALGALASPIDAAADTFVGQPLEKETGIPADLTNFLATAIFPLAAVKGVNVAANALKGIKRPVSADLAKAANYNYAAAKVPKFSTSKEFVDNLSKRFKQIADKNIHQKNADVAGKYDEAVQWADNFAEKYSKTMKTDFGSQRFTFGTKAFKEIDQKLTSMIADLGENFEKNKVVINKLRDMKTELRASINEIPDSMLRGSKQGIKAYREAVRDWTKKSQMETIESIIRNAEVDKNPASYMASQMRDIYRNKRDFNTFPKQVQKLIKKAAKPPTVLGAAKDKFLGDGVVGLNKKAQLEKIIDAISSHKESLPNVPLRVTVPLGASTQVNKEINTERKR